VQEILIDDSILSICKTRTAPMKRAGQMLKEVVAESSLRLKTGFEPLDKVMCGGFNRRGICQILGQPKTGKTTFIHLCMKHYLENNKKKILYLSPIDETKVLHKRVGLCDADWLEPLRFKDRGGVP
jgi:predicted ATP-dependent serine protease